MFYFESIKVKADSFTSPYTLTIKLEDTNTYFLSATNKEWLNSIFEFTKNNKNHIHGSWFIDEYNLSNMDNNNFKSFINKNITFCDQQLIINYSWNVKKIINFYKWFFKYSLDDVKSILKICQIDNSVDNTRIKDLNKINKLKLLLALSLFKESKYIICNFVNWDLDTEECLILKTITNSIVSIYNKTIVCFVDNNDDFNYLDLENKDYLNYHKLLTLGEAQFDKHKKHFHIDLIKFASLIKILKYELIGLWLTNLTLMFISIFMLSLTQVGETETHINGIIIYIKNNFLVWNLISYFIYVLSYVNTILWWCLMNKKLSRYNQFLNNLGTNLVINSIIWPIVVISIISANIIIGFTITYIVFYVTITNIAKLWFVLCVFLYMIYFLILSIGLFIKINQSIKQITLKESLIKIISI